MHGFFSCTAGIMKDRESRSTDAATVAEEVRAFYEHHRSSLIDGSSEGGRALSTPDRQPLPVLPEGSIFLKACGSDHRHRLQCNECALYSAPPADTISVQERLPPGAGGCADQQDTRLQGSNHANRFNGKAFIRCQ